MRIGFDAKRAFFNRSGLGNYSRFIIASLVNFHEQNNYFLYTPKRKNQIDFIPIKDRVYIASPRQLLHKLFSAYWRSVAVSKDLYRDKIEIFHGLSGEIPKGLSKSHVKSVVTIHDLIFMRYPELYKPIDRKIYEKKFKYACENADKIIAISEQTKQDIVSFFSINPDKIEVIYQGCNERFRQLSTPEEKTRIRDLYRLPHEYLLYVGTIEKRKNLLSILKAMNHGNIETPLVVVGKQTAYFNEIQSFIEEHKMKQIHFLKGVPNEHLPTIYQMAKLFIYPSVFEGFGIPILEALCSNIPVITSKGSCFPEAGGPSSIYVDPENYTEIAENITNILNNKNLSDKMIHNGFDYAQDFLPKKLTDQLLNLYIRTLNA